MLPMLLMDYAAYRVSVKPILPCETNLPFSGFPSTSNCSDRLRVQFGVSIAFASCSIFKTGIERRSFRLTALGAFITHIIGWGSRKEVSRIYAGRVIAPVHHKKTNGVNSGIEEKRYAVGANRASTNVAQAVSVSVNPAVVTPTLVGAALLNFTPKPFNLLRSNARQLIVRSSHDLNLRDRLGCGQARLLLKQLAGRLYFNTVTPCRQ